MKHEYSWLGGTLLGRKAYITVDRRLGSRNIRHNNITYTINSGYFDVEKDYQEKHKVYIIGTFKVNDNFEGIIQAVINRRDVDELIIVVSPSDQKFYATEIKECLSFYERQHRSEIDYYISKLCGVVLYKLIDGRPYYMINDDSNSGAFISGSMEFGETEKETAERYVLEKTGINVSVEKEFRSEYTNFNNKYNKVKSVYFLAECSKNFQGGYFLPYPEAVKKISAPQDIIVLMEANDFYEQKRKGIKDLQ